MVSIPFWVFSLSRPSMMGLRDDTTFVFQSRSGFSPCFDRIGMNGNVPSHHVSIPFWVFSLLRLAQAGHVRGSFR